MPRRPRFSRRRMQVIAPGYTAHPLRSLDRYMPSMSAFSLELFTSGQDGNTLGCLGVYAPLPRSRVQPLMHCSETKDGGTAPLPRLRAFAHPFANNQGYSHSLLHGSRPFRGNSHSVIDCFTNQTPPPVDWGRSLEYSHAGAEQVNDLLG